MIVWVTGLSGAGKTALCEALLTELKPRMNNLVRLDGDVVREIFGNDIGHSEPERVVQIKRIQSIARELDNQGFVVLVAALYSREDLLRWNRAEFSGYFEVYLDTPLSEVKRRDSKGLYAKAERGEMSDVVGIDIPWHPPVNADLVLDGASADSQTLAGEIIASVHVFRDAIAGARPGAG